VVATDDTVRSVLSTLIFIAVFFVMFFQEAIAMEFNGTFEIEGIDPEEVWLALSDPVTIETALPGCQFLLRVEEDDPDFDALRERIATMDEERAPFDETDSETVAERSFEEGDRYAALMELKVGPVNPSFETVVTLTEREFPRMLATGEGSSSNSFFDLESWLELSETEDGTKIEWGAESDISGRIAQMGQRAINPVANKVINQFFNDIESQLTGLDEEDKSRFARIRDAL
jgi:carbon monoxide dehydrogenase subunit G